MLPTKTCSIRYRCVCVGVGVGVCGVCGCVVGWGQGMGKVYGHCLHTRHTECAFFRWLYMYMCEHMHKQV